MRILLITHYFEPDSGAAAVRLARLAKQLVARGHAVTVLATMPHYPAGKTREGYRRKFTITEECDGVKIVHAWLWATSSTRISRRLLSQLSFMAACFLRGLAIKRPDVVLIEGQPVFTSLAGVLVSKFKRVPQVQNVSDLWPEYLVAVNVMKDTRPLYRVFKALVNFIQRDASGIAALYPSILDSIKAHIGDGPNRRVIFNAVDLKRFRPDQDAEAFRHKHGLERRKLVTFVGTFGTHIDFETMLETTSKFKDRDDVRFVFIGTGGQQEKVNTRLAKGDLDNTVWIGWIDHNEMPLAWAASDVTFWAIHDHPLYRDILQSKIYEAMASGTPVAIAVEGITTQIVDAAGAGFTVPFKDADALAQAITRLLDDDTLRQQCARSARAYAEANFDPDRVADTYEQVLSAVVNARAANCSGSGSLAALCSGSVSSLLRGLRGRA